jgi:CubicO group peptidase (beta-lactamase class C family)
MKPTLTDGDPDAAGLRNEPMARLDDDLNRAVATRIPGAVVLIARHGVVAKATAYGFAQTCDGDGALSPPRAMHVDTVFDVASITKVAATTAAMMRLVDDGRVDLADHVVDHLPEFAGPGKANVTIRDLLTHRAGLAEWQPVYLWARCPADAISFIGTFPLCTPPGTERRYSDLGFMLLGEIVHRVTAEPLDAYARRVVHEPLGMADTDYLPADPSRIAATSNGNDIEYRMIADGSLGPVDGAPEDFDGWRRRTLLGEANDGNAYYAFGGVAGHAGLFSTARDLAVFGQALLNGGSGLGRVWSPEIVAEFTRDQIDRGQGLGFWTQRLPELCGLGAGGFGHRGFTGCEFLVAPEHDLVVVLLTNRLHACAGAPDIEPIWHQVLRRVGEAMTL